MLYAVIMAGGAGTRLWPESRRDWPKQLLNIQGDRTMIQATVDRLGDLVPAERVLVATTESLAGKIHEQLSQLPRESMLCEPYPRNTAPCIGLAAVRILREDPEAVMAVMPADHVIEPDESFRSCIRFAAALIDEGPGRLVTFGIRPTYPATTFGYIERRQPLESAAAASLDHPPPAYRVKGFREKPPVELASEYVSAGTFYWNSGIFLWKARTILEALEKYEPEIFARLKRIGEAADSSDFPEVLDREFAVMKKISIDYAVMERADEVVVIEAPFGWDDVGSWRALERLRPRDGDGNVIDAARHIQINTAETIARSADPNHVLVTVGVKDLIVIVTPDATLVADKNDEEALRQVTGLLKERGWDEYL